MKVKLRYVTEEQYIRWKKENCNKFETCELCPMNKASCRLNPPLWVSNKDMYSDKFLDQEIEIAK